MDTLQTSGCAAGYVYPDLNCQPIMELMAGIRCIFKLPIVSLLYLGSYFH